MKTKMVDISAETFGKYQHGTFHRRSGMWYADSDFLLGGCLKRGALPDPWAQNTPELLAKAKAMHEKAAEKAARQAMWAVTGKPWWRFW